MRPYPSYSAQKLDGKKLCKYYVQKGLGLSPEGNEVNKWTELVNLVQRAPLVVCISRLVAQKGLHLIIHAINRVKELVSLFLI